MEIATRIVVLVHLLGFATLFGGIVTQLRSVDPEVNAAMLHGAWLELVSGVALVVLLVLREIELPYAQLSVKLVLTLLLVLLVSKNRKFQSIPRGLLGLMGGFTLASAGLAVLWP